MRASTLLGLAIALMLGVVAVAGVRYSGILSPKPVPPPPQPPPPVLVLASKQNLFKGTATTLNDVVVRRATRAEEDFILKNPDKVFRPNPEAANLRILDRNVAAEELLLKEYFVDLKLPASVGERLAPGMRAVDLELPKDRTAAGLLRVGEHVDVFLTTKILIDPSGGPPRTAIAPIAQNLKIIVKRGIPYTVVIPVPKDEPLSFMVEANPYRAALIEYSKSKGILTLSATPAGGPAPGEGETKSEQLRVDAFLKGKTAVGEADLERIFHLPPLLPRPLPLRVENYAGTEMKRVITVEFDGGSGFAPAGAYRFVNPEDTSGQAAQPKTAVAAPAPPVNNLISPPKGPPPAKKK